MGISIVLNALVSAAAFHVPLSLRAVGGISLVIGATAFFNFSSVGGPIERRLSLSPWTRNHAARISTVSRNSADEAESGQLLELSELAPSPGDVVPVLGRALSQEEMCRSLSHEQICRAGLSHLTHEEIARVGLKLDMDEIELAEMAASVLPNGGGGVHPLPAWVASPPPASPGKGNTVGGALSPRREIAPALSAASSVASSPPRLLPVTVKPCGQTDTVGGVTTLPLRTAVSVLRGWRETCSQRSPRGDIRCFNDEASTASSPLAAGPTTATVPKAAR